MGDGYVLSEDNEVSNKFPQPTRQLYLQQLHKFFGDRQKRQENCVTAVAVTLLPPPLCHLMNHSVTLIHSFSHHQKDTETKKNITLPNPNHVSLAHLLSTR